MQPDSFVPVCRVVKTHGLKGEVAVTPVSDLPFVLPVGLRVWLVPPPAAIRQATIESARETAKGVILKLAEVDSIDSARHLVGVELLAHSAEIPDVEVEEEFDPIGFAVTDITRGPLGEVTDVIVTGANDVWVIEGTFGEVLIPVIDDVILDIDEDAETIEVRLLDGLIDDGDDS